MDYEEYRHMLRFKEECELMYWYGEKTYGDDGQVHMKDENGQPVEAFGWGEFTVTPNAGGDASGFDDGDAGLERICEININCSEGDCTETTECFNGDLSTGFLNCTIVDGIQYCEECEFIDNVEFCSEVTY